MRGGGMGWVGGGVGWLGVWRLVGGGVGLVGDWGVTGIGGGVRVGVGVGEGLGGGGELWAGGIIKPISTSLFTQSLQGLRKPPSSSVLITVAELV